MTGIFYNKGEVAPPGAAAGAALIYEQVCAAAEQVAKFTRRRRSRRCPPGGAWDRSPPKRSSTRCSSWSLGKDEGVCPTGGQAHDNGTGKGYYIEPTALAMSTTVMRIAQEEIFGPVRRDPRR